MTPDCIAPEQLDELLALPDDDPRRRHAASCPRCGALVEEYRLYRAAEPPPGGLDLDRLERTLNQRMTAEIAKAAGPAPRPRSAKEAEDGFLQRLFHPAMRPAWAFGIASLVLVGVLVLPNLLERSDVVLRGNQNATGAPAILDATLAADRLALRWHSVPGADGYRVRFESARELRELAHQAVGRDTVLELVRATLPFPMAAGDTVVVRVEALAGGDVIAVSPARAIVTR